MHRNIETPLFWKPGTNECRKFYPNTCTKSIETPLFGSQVLTNPPACYLPELCLWRWATGHGPLETLSHLGC